MSKFKIGEKVFHRDDQGFPYVIKNIHRDQYNIITYELCGDDTERAYIETDLCKLSDEQTGPLDVQTGGSHYKNLKIQPIEFIYANKIPFIEANVIKYICRWKKKNGLEDLKKVKHYVDLLIELEGLDEEK
jgi:hypothetical protein